MSRIADCGHLTDMHGLTIDLIVDHYIRGTAEVCHDCWEQLDALRNDRAAGNRLVAWLAKVYPTLKSLALADGGEGSK